jgi:hypothetical protein
MPIGLHRYISHHTALNCSANILIFALLSTDLGSLYESLPFTVLLYQVFYSSSPNALHTISAVVA